MVFFSPIEMVKWSAKHMYSIRCEAVSWKSALNVQYLITKMSPSLIAGVHFLCEPCFFLTHKIVAEEEKKTTTTTTLNSLNHLHLCTQRLGSVNIVKWFTIANGCIATHFFSFLLLCFVRRCFSWFVFFFYVRIELAELKNEVT